MATTALRLGDAARVIDILPLVNEEKCEGGARLPKLRELRNGVVIGERVLLFARETTRARHESLTPVGDTGRAFALSPTAATATATSTLRARSPRGARAASATATATATVVAMGRGWDGARTTPSEA